MRAVKLFTLGMTLFGFFAQAVNYKVRVVRNGNTERIVGAKVSTLETGTSTRRKIMSVPLYIKEFEAPSREMYEEYIVSSSNLNAQEKEFLSIALKSKTSHIPQNTEVRTLIHQGDSKNRIDFTILGDGYLNSEKERFFADAARTTKGLFEGSTFKNYLALFNVHAVFVPSNESGIGDGEAIDTAYGLFRKPKGSKRAIMPGKEYALDQALDLAPDTDFPIVLANDDCYGGLGGRYSISTRSERSGLIVLRHELGHSIGEVGEEYDSGRFYAGANSSQFSHAQSWAHWADQGMQSFESTLLSGAYVWKNLKDSAYTATFKVLPDQQTIASDISSVGWDTPDDVQITLDGKALPIIGEFHNDRNFFSFGPVSNVSPGEHTVQIEEKISDGNNILGLAFFYSYAKNYDFLPHRIGAFATYDEMGFKTYRPTHSSCLMRNMKAENFCVVDQENIWNKLLKRMSLIDDLELQSSGQEIIATVKTPPLGGLIFSWYRIVENGSEERIAAPNHLNSIRLPRGPRYRAKVHFQTSDVRKYNKYFTAARDFN